METNENKVCNVKHTLDGVDLAKVKQIGEALSIFKVAVENLCKEPRNLLQAERLVMFTINKLKELKCVISREILERFHARWKTLPCFCCY